MFVLRLLGFKYTSEKVLVVRTSICMAEILETAQTWTWLLALGHVKIGCSTYLDRYLRQKVQPCT